MFLPYYYQDAHTRAFAVNTTLERIEPADVIHFTNDDGTEYREEVFNFRTFPFKKVFADAPLRQKRGKNKDKILYYDLVATFDIETTTIQGDPPFSFMYHWQFCIEDIVFFGRTWQDFQDLLAILQKELNLSINEDKDGQRTGRGLVVYVCNLSFEFQFCRYYLPPLVSSLFTDKYKPLFVATSSGIVFRCAQRLFNKSLEKITKGYPHEKLKGDLDYRIIRTSKTKLKDLEKAYCYNDVRGLSEAIRDRLTRDSKYNIANIPLTSTGYVRKDCQRAMAKNPENRRQFLRTKLNPKLYGLCRDAFRGGNTHLNAVYNGVRLQNVASCDISSSYPFQCLVRGFPHGKWKRISNADALDHFGEIIKTHCLLLRCVFFDLEYIAPDNIAPLSVSKCIINDYAPTRKHQTRAIKVDNGRVFKADKIETCLTEIDLITILSHYDYKEVAILEAYAAERRKLPEELRATILDYYKAKTLLKHSTDPDEIYNYNRAKELLNSTYGMMTQRIDRVNFELKNNIYVPSVKPLEDQINDFYNSRASFLRYDQGLYVTAWARYQLQEAIDIVKGDFVYCDTDSCKYLHPERYTAQFDALNNKLRRMAEKAGAIAYTRDGEAVPCGVFDFEQTYTDFMCLGAKKYIYSYDQGETIHATIAGVNKEVGQNFFTSHGFDAFTDGQVLAESGKLTAYYDDTPPHDITINGVTMNTAASVSLIDAPYTINVKGEYQEFIDYLRRSVEQFYIK